MRNPWLLALPMLVGACAQQDSGQTGSPTCREACACEVLSHDQTSVIAEVVAASSEDVTVRVVRSLANGGDPGSANHFSPGDLISGPLLPNGGFCLKESIGAISAGDTVLALVQWTPSGSDGCPPARCPEDGSCADASQAEQCDGGPLAPAKRQLVLAPAKDPLEFADGTHAAFADLPRLSRAPDCEAEYGTCKDTGSIETHASGCSLAPASNSVAASARRVGGLVPVSVAWVLALVARRVRRRRAR